MAKDELDDELYENDDEDEDEDEDDDEDDDEYPEFTVQDLDQLDTKGSQNCLIEGVAVKNFPEIVKWAEERDVPLTFEDCQLFGGRLPGAKIDMFFDDVIFADGLDSSGGQLEGTLQFIDAYFSQPVDFSNAIIEKNIEFDDCSFEKDTSFVACHFKGTASFKYCEFEQGAIFDKATFDEFANFGRATFTKPASYKEARFENGASLKETDFIDGIDKTDSNLDVATGEKPAAAEEPMQDDHGPASVPSENEPAENAIPDKPEDIKTNAKEEFNPWRELERVSKKTVSRRQILRKAFRLIPKREE